MAHQRRRHLTDLIRRTLGFSPIVGILGHRQVGKTTLVSDLADRYLTLDVAEDLANAQSDAASFLASHVSTGAPTVIDECQLAPPLFPALKEWVRTRRAPGQFLLTGSVRFASRKAIREALTGRIIIWELLPMDWSEQHEAPLPSSLLRLIKAKEFGMALRPCDGFNRKTYERAIMMGGLPGVFAVRNPAIRSQRFETQIATILERDLRLILETSLGFKSLRRLFAALAKQVGGALNVAEISRETRISLPTLRKLLAAFEALFLIRMVPCEGDYLKPLLFFEDIGEWNHLLGPHQKAESVRLSAFLFHHLRVQVHYRPDEQVETFSFRDRSGNFVPLCFRSKNGVLGVIALGDDEGIAEANLSARAFLGRYLGSKVLIVGVKDRDELLARDVRWIGAGRLLT